MRPSYTCTLGRSRLGNPIGTVLCLVILLTYPHLQPNRCTASRTRSFTATFFRASVIAEGWIFSTGSMILRNSPSSRLNLTLRSATSLKNHSKNLLRGEWSQRFTLEDCENVGLYNQGTPKFRTYTFIGWPRLCAPRTHLTF